MPKQFDIKVLKEEIDAFHSTLIKKTEFISKYTDKKTKSRMNPIPPEIRDHVKEYVKPKKDKMKWLNQFPKAQQTEIQKYARYYTDTIDRDKCSFQISELQKNISDYMMTLDQLRIGLNDIDPLRNKKKDKKLEITAPGILQKTLIQVLQDLGGKADKRLVIERMEEILKNDLTDDDRKISESPNERWQGNVGWERWRLVKNGVMSDDSPRGIWELKKKSQKKRIR